MIYPTIVNRIVGRRVISRKMALLFLVFSLLFGVFAPHLAHAQATEDEAPILSQCIIFEEGSQLWWFKSCHMTQPGQRYYHPYAGWQTQPYEQARSEPREDDYRTRVKFAIYGIGVVAIIGDILFGEDL